MLCLFADLNSPPPCPYLQSVLCIVCPLVLRVCPQPQAAKLPVPAEPVTVCRVFFGIHSLCLLAACRNFSGTVPGCRPHCRWENPCLLHPVLPPEEAAVHVGRACACVPSLLLSVSHRPCLSAGACLFALPVPTGPQSLCLVAAPSLCAEHVCVYKIQSHFKSLSLPQTLFSPAEPQPACITYHCLWQILWLAGCLRGLFLTPSVCRGHPYVQSPSLPTELSPVSRAQPQVTNHVPVCQASVGFCSRCPGSRAFVVYRALLRTGRRRARRRVLRRAVGRASPCLEARV